MISCPIVLQNHLDAQLNFSQEMEKLPITNFSLLELTFESSWHVYGALVLQLLRMRRIHAATKSLKISLPWWPQVILCHGYRFYMFSKRIYIGNSLS
jgi:hypothetical protein